MGKVTNDTHGFFHYAAQNFLKDPNKFKEDMITWDKEHIKESVVKKVNGILQDKDFSLADILKASEALGGITKWAMAMMKYYELLKIVNPKRAKVKEMTDKLVIVRANLAQK